MDRYLDALVPLPEHVALHVRQGLEDDEDCNSGLEMLLMFVDERHAPPSDLHARLLQLLEETSSPSLAVQLFNTLKQIQRYHRCGSHTMLWSPVKEGTRREWTRFLDHVQMLQSGPKVFNALQLVQYYILILEESLAHNQNCPQKSLLAKLLLASENAEGARRELVEVLFDILSPERGSRALRSQSDDEDEDYDAVASSKHEKGSAGSLRDAEEAKVDGGEEGDSYLVAQRLLQLLIGLEGMYCLLAPIMSGFTSLGSLEEKERFLETVTIPGEKAVLLENLLVRDFRHPDPKQARALREAHGTLDTARLCSYMLLEPKAISEDMLGKSDRVSRASSIDYLVLVVCHLVQAFLLQRDGLKAAEATDLKAAVSRFSRNRSRNGTEFCKRHCHFLAAFLERVPVLTQ